MFIDRIDRAIVVIYYCMEINPRATAGLGRHVVKVSARLQPRAAILGLVLHSLHLKSI